MTVGEGNGEEDGRGERGEGRRRTEDERWEWGEG